MYSLIKLCSNNMTEYNVLITGLQIDKEMRLNIISLWWFKTNYKSSYGEYEVTNEDLVSYHWVVVTWAERFKGFYIDYVSRKDNIHANVLASLIATLMLPAKVGQKILVASRNLYYHKHALEINKIVKENQKEEKYTKFQPIWNSRLAITIHRLCIVWYSSWRSKGSASIRRRAGQFFYIRQLTCSTISPTI